MQPPPLNLEAEPTPQPMSLVGRLFNVFATPGEVFDDVKNTPPTPSNWIVPGLLITLVGIIGSWLVFSQPAIEQQLKEISMRAVELQITKMKASEEKAEQIRNQAESIGAIGTKVAFYGAPVLLGFVTPFIWGLVLWLGGRMFFKVDFVLMKSVEAVGLAGMVSLLELVVRNLLILVTGNVFAGPSLVMFIKEFDPQNSLHGILALANVLVLWLLAVRSLALARLAGVSFMKAALLVFGFWAAYNGLLIGMGALAKAIFS